MLPIGQSVEVQLLTVTSIENILARKYPSKLQLNIQWIL